MQNELEAYLKADRQWSRIHRIRHARLQARLNKDNPGGLLFWNAVLTRNGVVSSPGRGFRILPSTSFTLERSLRNEEAA